MKLLLITFLLFSTYCFSQKQYEFDYLIEYEYTVYKDTLKIKNHPLREKIKTTKKYYLTNSKKNNYTARMSEVDSLNYRIVFLDQNEIHSNVTVLKSDFIKAEFINIECKYISEYVNRHSISPYKYQTKNYDFFKLNDTLINGETYSKYKFGSNKPKRAKRKGLATLYYIIKNGTEFHSPILTFPTAYEEWKVKRNIPNGIYIEKYLLDSYGQLNSKETLVNYWKIDKKIVIQKGCD